MIHKKGLSREALANITAGAEEQEIIPAPPPGYKYCDYWRTCPNFDYRVCIFKIDDIGPDGAVSKSCI